MSTENDYKSILITEKSLANTCEETDNETTNDSDNISNSSMIKMDKISSKFFSSLEIIQNQFRKGTLKGSFFILITSTCGAGILSLPQAVMRSGLYWSILQFVFCAYLGYFTTLLLVQCADISKKFSYMTLASATYGKSMTFFVKITFFLCNWGFCVAYIVLINKLLAHLMLEFFHNTNVSEFLIDPNGKFWACFVIIVYGFPMSLFKSLAAIRFTFILGISFVVYYSFVIVYESFDENISNLSQNFDHAGKFEFGGILKTLPLAIFSYTCHSNVLEVYKELKHQKRENMSKILFIVMVSACILYIFVGCFGYLTFAHNPSEILKSGGIILLSNYQGSLLIKIALLFICFSVIFTFPLYIKPTKEGLKELLIPKKEENYIIHFLLTLCVVSSSLIAALLVKDMSDVLTLMGATINPLICFFFPCMFYFKYANYHKECWKRKLKRGFAFMLLIFTFVFMFFGIADFFKLF